MDLKLSEKEVPEFRKAFESNLPFSLKVLKIKLTDRCNSRCKLCTYWRKEDKSTLEKENVVQLLDEGKELGVEKVTFTGGEPTLHPDFQLFMKKAFEKEYKVSLITNGIIFPVMFPRILVEENKKGLTVVFSLDSSESKIHDELRGVKGSFENIIKSLNILRPIKDKYKIKISISTTVSEKNYKDIKNIISRKEELGFDSISFYPARDFVGSDSNPDLENLNANYMKEFKEEEIPKIKDLSGKGLVEKSLLRFSDFSLPKRCYLPFFQIEVDSDGEAFICCHSLENRNEGLISIGNIYERSLGEIWNSKELKFIREKCHNINFPFCRDCIYKGLNDKIDKTLGT